MTSIKHINQADKKLVLKAIYERNEHEAAQGLNGVAVRRLKPTKENLKRFQEQFANHPMCGCYACLQSAKWFITNNHDIKETVIAISTQDVEVAEISISNEGIEVILP